MHFAIAVFHDEDELVEDILAPYNENDTEFFSEFDVMGSVSDIRKSLNSTQK